MRIFGVGLAALALALPCWAHGAPALVLNTAFYAPITAPAHDGVLDLLYAELFRRAGVPVTLQAASAERALLNANNGIDDGDVARIAGIEATYRNLVRVPEPVMSYQMVAFSRHAGATASDLKPYDVGILTGWKVLEGRLGDSRSLLKLETGSQLFAMLDKQRIDVAVFEKYEGLHFIATMGLKGIGMLQPVFAEGDWFLYLHKKHQALAPLLAEHLRRMKRDGSHRRILERVLGPYARQAMAWAR